MQPKIIGTTMPVLEITLGQGEGVLAESGKMSWMTPNIEMSTTTGHGIMGKIKRLAGGGSLFQSTFTANGPGEMVAFATTVPGEILPVPIDATQNYMIHRHGFVAGTIGIEISVGFQQSLGAGLFGGDGFILQKLAGQGEAWVQLQGEVVTYDLAPGQTILVHPAHVGMFSVGTEFKITTVKGIRNKFFGGELFLCRLTGPGRIWLQSLTLPGLAADLTPFLPIDDDK